MRPIILSAFLLTLVAATSAAAQEFSPMPAPVTAREPNFGIRALETVGASVGGIAGLGIGLMYYAVAISSGVDEPEAAPWALAIGLPFATAGLAAGATGVGAAFRQGGRFWPTLAWSAASVAGGLAIAAGGNYLGNNDVGPLGQLAPVVVAIGLVAPPILTTIGYNRSRPQKTISGRFLPGSVALGSVRDADGTAHPSLDVRLVTMRF